jgi:PAS domain S-box-containing protein/putative nucleotidyltransferase with HDIG domain
MDAQPLFNENELTFRMVIESFMDAVLAVDSRGIIVRINQQLTSLLGFAPVEVIGKSIDILIPEANREAHRRQMEAYWQSPTHRPMGTALTLKARTREGETVPVDVSLNPIQNSGQPYVIVTIRDNSAIVDAYEETLAGWSRAMDFRDKETENHTQRVTALSVMVARQMGLSVTAITHLRRGALLHDIGKMAVPDEILNKPGPLTDAEWVEMRKHPDYAYEMLYPIRFLRPALDIPYCHHERWDGSGYPRGLREQQIPIAARIFAVVDVWDAITADRPYRKAMSKAAAQQYILENAGKLFDPAVVKIFFEVIQRAEQSAFPVTAG